MVKVTELCVLRKVSEYIKGNQLPKLHTPDHSYSGQRKCNPFLRPQGFVTQESKPTNTAITLTLMHRSTYNWLFDHKATFIWPGNH